MSTLHSYKIKGNKVRVWGYPSRGAKKNIFGARAEMCFGNVYIISPSKRRAYMNLEVAKYSYDPAKPNNKVWVAINDDDYRAAGLQTPEEYAWEEILDDYSHPF
jgi:hypothetical protein